MSSMSSSASLTPATVHVDSARSSPTLPAPRALWRWAGALGLLHVILMVAGTVVRGAPVVHEGHEGIEHSFVEGDLTRIYTSGYLMTLALVALVPVLVFLARQLGIGTEVGHRGTPQPPAQGQDRMVVVGQAAPQEDVLVPADVCACLAMAARVSGKGR